MSKVSSKQIASAIKPQKSKKFAGIENINPADLEELRNCFDLFDEK